MSEELIENVDPCDTPIVFDVNTGTVKKAREKEVDGDDPYLEETMTSDTYLSLHTESRDIDLLVADGWINLYGDDELKKIIIDHGEPNTKPEHGYICKFNMVGCLKDGTTIDDFEPLIVQVGDAEVIIGIDLVLVTMDVGEKSLIEISPDLAYGSLGRKPEVPPNEALIYLVQLLAAQPEPALSTYTTAELTATGARKRERGNWWNARQEPTIALGCYKRALDYLGYENRPLGDAPSDNDKLIEERLKVYNNIAAIHLKMAEYQVALEAIDYVLALRPHNVKALYRKGKVLTALGQHAGALKVLSLAMEFDPENKEVRQEMDAIVETTKKESQDVRKLYRKMFGNDDEDTSVTVETPTENAKTAKTETVKSETVKKETAKIKTVPNPPNTKAKTKNQLNSIKTKPKLNAKSKLGIFACCAVTGAAAGYFVYRYKPHLW